MRLAAAAELVEVGALDAVRRELGSVGPPPRGGGYSRRLGAKELRRAMLAALATGALVSPDHDARVPRRRSECIDGPRPCPWIRCQHHLYLEVLTTCTGAPSIHLNFPHLAPWELEESCALDLADAGPMSLAEIGAALNVTRQRVEQILGRALEKVGLRVRADGGVVRSLPRRRDSGCRR